MKIVKTGVLMAGGVLVGHALARTHARSVGPEPARLARKLKANPQAAAR